MAFDRNAEADQAYGHKPVLLDECLEALAIRPDGVYLDGTLGRAGHSLEILRRLTAGGRLIGLDRDGTALEAARVRLAEYADRVTLVHSNFSRLAEVLDDLHIDAVDGMLFDLGVSSPQLDDAERGFSYMHDAPLDMRMDRTAGLTARDVVNGWSYEELRRILFEYGEERYAPAVAGAIVHKDEFKIRAVAGFHLRRHAGGFFIKKRHRFFFIVTGYDQTDEHGRTCFRQSFCWFYYSVVLHFCKQWI